jgi:hypothetical protein
MKLFFKIFSLVLFAQLAGSLAFAACDCSGPMIPIPKPSECGACVAAPGCTWDGSKICPVSTGSGNSAVNLTNPLGETKSVPALIGKIIKASLGVVGSLALVMFIYGGFIWMLAAGNEQAVTKGKNVLTWAALGLVVIFASYSLVNFVIDSITKKGG